MNFPGLLPLLVLFPSLLLHSALSAHLNTMCSTKTSKANSPYDTNLKNVIESLKSKANHDKSSHESSDGKSPNTAYGMFQCRGDATNSECKSCVRAAAAKLLYNCANKKEGITWFDDCLLHYADYGFFNTVDYGHKFYLPANKDPVITNPAMFRAQVKNFLIAEVTDNAARSGKWFSEGDKLVDVGGGKRRRVYALAQCTKGIGKQQCGNCLATAVKELHQCCDSKAVGGVFTGSCYFRYQLSPF